MKDSCLTMYQDTGCTVLSAKQCKEAYDIAGVYNRNKEVRKGGGELTLSWVLHPSIYNYPRSVFYQPIVSHISA